MGELKQINIKNQAYYFYNDITDIENFDSSLLKLDKKSYKDISIYNIGYITIKNIGNCNNINSVNLLYLHIFHASGYTEEKDENKYIIFDYTDEDKEVLKKHNEIFDGLIDEIKAINSSKKIDYAKDYMKIKFISNDILPINKAIKFHLMTISIRCVFGEDSKLYPQVFLNDTLHKE